MQAGGVQSEEREWEKKRVEKEKRVENGEWRTRVETGGCVDDDGQ